MGHHWMDISEYSRIFSISISTIRRRIKKETLETKKESGKYLIKVPKNNLPRRLQEQEKNIELEKRIRLLQEEVQELRMLVNIYERRGQGINVGDLARDSSQ